MSEQPEAVPRLALDQAAKAFGAVQALTDGSISLFGGEAHALVGENGAGKSTLGKIVAGAVLPDRGEIRVRRRVVSHRSPRDAIQLKSDAQIRHRRVPRVRICGGRSVVSQRAFADQQVAGLYVRLKAG